MEKNNWLSILKNWAEVQPDKIIFKEAGGSAVTYAQFYHAVCNTAADLLTAFSNRLPEAPVAVSTDRNINSLIGILGVYAAGGWYVPVDISQPAERLQTLLGICSPGAILLSTDSDPFTFSELTKIKVNLSYEPCSAAFPVRDEHAPMFGIFTSGSTGLPKLVVKTDFSMMSFIKAYCSEFDFSSNEIFGNQIPFYFDASTKDVFSTIFLGATSIVIPQPFFSFPMRLINLINEEAITSFVCVPSVLNVLARFDVFSEAHVDTLKNILFVGERMPLSTLNYLIGALPNTRFVNLYGSTEVAGNSCYYIVNRHFENDEVLPIGHPFSTSQVFLLDEEDNPTDEGEICVGGTGLALGYYNDPEKTANAFKNVSIPAVSFSGRMYRSGDYGRKNEYGEFVCVSRKDSLIKHMGHRIELGDIEASALSLNYIHECCCLYAPEYEKMLLFCSCSAEDKKHLRKDLSTKLPKYMIPHEFICMDDLPHNRNGKIDRTLLIANWRESQKQSLQQ